MIGAIEANKIVQSTDNHFTIIVLSFLYSNENYRLIGSGVFEKN